MPPRCALMLLPLLLACSVRSVDPEGRPCSADDDCGPGTVCDTQTWRCVARSTDLAICDASLLDQARGPDGPRRDGPRPDATDVDSGPTPSWITVPAGTFTMGSPAGEACHLASETQHPVELTHSFEMQRTEVTQQQFSALMGDNPSAFSGCDQCPVENVSWHRSAAYCNALSQQAGLALCYQCTGTGSGTFCGEATAYTGKSIYDCPGYRLPTDAEWERAYRAGGGSALYSGPSDAAGCATCSCTACGKIGWFCGNAGGKTHPVAQRQPNAWGLYDLAGNVWEWCHDRYLEDLGAAKVTDPAASSTAQDRVVRGGAWNADAEHLRAARRANDPPGKATAHSGFRCVRTL